MIQYYTGQWCEYDTLLHEIFTNFKNITVRTIWQYYSIGNSHSAIDHRGNF